jgi:hypothetical protein
MPNVPNLSLNEARLKQELSSHDLEFVSVAQHLPDGRIDVNVSKMQAVPGPNNEPVYVPLSVTARVTLDKRGRLKAVESDTPQPDAISSAEQMIHTLIENKQLSVTGDLHPGETHKIEVDTQGRRILTRQRFSAF